MGLLGVQVSRAALPSLSLPPSPSPPYLILSWKKDTLHLQRKFQLFRGGHSCVSPRGYCRPEPLLGAP